MNNPSPTDFGASIPRPEDYGASSIIDGHRGAPLTVRSAVGASGYQDKLATIQQYYPDAQPFGDDNFIYRDPETKILTKFNPSGFDIGDLSENARSIFEFVGGSIGGATAVAGGQFGPQLGTPEEIYTVPAGVGFGAAVGGKVHDVVADVLYPNVDTRTSLKKAIGSGTDFLANATGQKAGELLPILSKPLMQKGSDVFRLGSDALYDVYKRTGLEATAGSIGSRTVQGMEMALSKLPISADIIGESYSRLLKGMEEFATNIAQGLSTTGGREFVGANVQKGAEKFVSQFQRVGKDLYDKITIPSGNRSSAENFGRVLKETVTEFQDNPEFAEMLTSPLLKQMASAYEASQKGGGLTWGTIKALRTKIGSAIDDKQLLNDTSQAELKRIYGALSDDMGDMASNTSPQALKAYERANAYWSAGRSRIDDILTPVVDKKLSQDVFQSALQGAKNGGAVLRALRKSLPKGDWDSVVAQQIREMGLATPGQQNATGDLFSPQSFMTNYNRLSQEAKKVLFSGEAYRGLERSMDDLLRVSESMKDLARMANTSGTAQQMVYMSMLAGGGWAGSQPDDQGEGMVQGVATSALLSLITPYATAKLFTSPKFISWLSKAPEFALKPNGISAHLGRLTTIAAEDELLAPAIYEYTDALRQVNQE